MAIFERKRYAFNRLIQLTAHASMEWNSLALRNPSYVDVLKVAMNDKVIREHFPGQDVRVTVRRVIAIVHDALGDDVLMHLAVRSVSHLIIQGYDVIQQHSNDSRTPKKDLQTSLLVNIIGSKIIKDYQPTHGISMKVSFADEALTGLPIPDVYREQVKEQLSSFLQKNHTRTVMCCFG